VVLFLLVVGLNTLPRQKSSHQINQHITNSFQIISSTLLNTEMCVDGGVSGSTRKILVLTVRDMLMSFAISIFLGKTKIDNVDNIGFFSETEKEVIGLDISMDVVSTVNEFDSGNLFLR